MDAAQRDPAVAELARDLRDLKFCLRWLSVVIIGVLSLPNLFVSLSVGHFEAIYMAALPGKPLPGLTLAVISLSRLHLLIGFVFLWPILGFLNVLWSPKTLTCLGGNIILVLFIGFQVFITWLALFLPMLSVMTGMSETAP